MVRFCPEAGTPRRHGVYCILGDSFHSSMYAKAYCFVVTHVYFPFLCGNPLIYYAGSMRPPYLRDWSMTINKSVMLRMKNLIVGAELIHANAIALYSEAQTLAKDGAFARAATLHQISMEECSKVDTLGGAVISILAGNEVNEAKLARSFRDHKAKNHVNAYNAKPTDEERSARECRDWDAARAAFKRFQDEFHKEMNEIKNTGLYVDYREGAFIAPMDAINEETAYACMQLNADFLRRGEDFVRLLKRIEADPGRFAMVTKAFLGTTKAVDFKSQLNDEAIIETIVEQMRLQLERRPEAGSGS